MKKLIENTTGVPIFAGGLMIQPGDSREIDVPGDGSTADATPDVEALKPDWPARLVELQALSVTPFKAGLQSMALSAEDLATLVTMEEAGDPPRSTVLEALAAAQLKLAQSATGGGGPLQNDGTGGSGDAPTWPEKLVALQKLSIAKLTPELPALTADELATLAAIEQAAAQPRTTVLKAIAAAQAALAGEPQA